MSGTVDVRATASDNGGVAGVQFLLDGQPLGAEDTSAPYERSWDTRGVANGAHQLAARARDEAGNQTHVGQREHQRQQRSRSWWFGGGVGVQ